ncbi:MAG: ABC transporter permease [Elainellaceae cyanobacterium]
MSLARVLAIAANVFREVIRDRILYLIALYALGLVLLAALLPQVAANTQDKILLDVGLGAIAIVGVTTAIVVGTTLITTEISKRTIYLLLVKPVTPADLIFGKHLGLTAVLGTVVGAMTLVYLLQLTLSGISYPWGSLLLSIGYTILELSLVVAIAILVSLLTGSLLAILMTLAVYLIGQLSPDLIALSQITDSPAMGRIVEVLYLVLPDLSRLNWRNQAVYGMDLLPDPATLAGHALYGVLYIILVLTLASAILSRREL